MADIPESSRDAGERQAHGTKENYENLERVPKPITSRVVERMIVVIDYTNHRGERYERHIQPVDFRWMESTPHHPDPGWFLHAFDCQKNVWRTFAMKDIHSWKPLIPA